MGINISEKSYVEVLGGKFYLSWIFGFTTLSMRGDSSTSSFPDVVFLNIPLAKFFIFFYVDVNAGIPKHSERYF